MKTIKLLFFIALGGLFPIIDVSAQSTTGQADQKMIVFKFQPEQDMFYAPYGGNDAQLKTLYDLVDQYRTDITSGKVQIRVNGYCSSFADAQQNLRTAAVRSNRVKSELITHKGLLENNFITRNQSATYEGLRDVVVVIMNIPVAAPVAATPPAPQPEPRPQPQPQPQPQQPQPQPQPEPEPVVEITPVRSLPVRPYSFALRTNLLYDAVLLPTLGVEWRVSEKIGLKLDGSYSHWGNENGRVQKVWIVNPEVRMYLLEKRRFYVGVSGNISEANVYKYLIGNMIANNIGYQGRIWNAGVTVGYQLYLSPRLSLDFNIGLGYNDYKYDTFNVVEGVRMIIDRDVREKYWGPTQAGINLVWKFNTNE